MAKVRVAEDQYELGENLYFFESPADGITDCLIIAHGAQAGAPEFRIPANTTIHFFARSRQPGRLPQGPIVSYDGENFTTHERFNVERNQTYQGGRVISDQVLGKAHGRHWENPLTRGPAQYYEAVRARIDEIHNDNGLAWLPHLVTIRNRRWAHMSKYIWLSRLIELVQGYDNSIVNFYSMACRIFASDDVVRKAGAQAFPVT
jgi:hypothetical protein